MRQWLCVHETLRNKETLEIIETLKGHRRKSAIASHPGETGQWGEVKGAGSLPCCRDRQHDFVLVGKLM